MNAFRGACRDIEAKAWTLLGPYLIEQTDGRLVVTAKGTLAKWLQESVGDLLVNDRQDRLYSVELKAEAKFTGNVFLETWSNRNLDKRENREHGSNTGWMQKLKSDLLLYYFLDTDDLYSFDLFTLQRWAFGYSNGDGLVRGNLHRHTKGGAYEFREVVQHKHKQANDTVGVIVPIRLLQTELPMRAVKQTKVRQRQLLTDDTLANATT